MDTATSLARLRIRLRAAFGVNAGRTSSPPCSPPRRIILTAADLALGDPLHQAQCRPQPSMP